MTYGSTTNCACVDIRIQGSKRRRNKRWIEKESAKDPLYNAGRPSRGWLDLQTGSEPYTSCTEPSIIQAHSYAFLDGILVAPYPNNLFLVPEKTIGRISAQHRPQ